MQILRFCHRNPSPFKTGGRRTPRRGLFLAWLLATSLFLAASPYPPVAAEGTILRVDPSQLSIGQGDLADLRILVDNVTNLYAADIRLTFDPNILEVVDLDESQEGIQVKPEEYPHPDNILRNTADNADGTVWYAVTQLARDPLTGSGAICTVRFRAKALGTSPIEIITDMAGLANSDGLLINTIVQAGQVTVVDVGSSVVPPLPPTRPATPATATPVTVTPVTVTPAAPTATSGAPDYPAPTTASAQPSPTTNQIPAGDLPAATSTPAEGYPQPGEVASPTPTGTPGSAPTGAVNGTVPAAATTVGTAIPAQGATALPTNAQSPTAANVPMPPTIPQQPSEPAPLISRGLFQFLMGALALGTVGLFVYLWRGKGN